MIHITGFIYTVVENLVILNFKLVTSTKLSHPITGILPVCSDSHKGIIKLSVPNSCYNDLLTIVPLHKNLIWLHAVIAKRVC